MKMYLACASIAQLHDPPCNAYVLESFVSVNKNTEKLLPLFGDFILDSGAFTFMRSKPNIVWEDYIDRYADWINRNNVDKFFELDIDKVVGYAKVCEYRKRLENATRRAPIPVWHRSRGMNEWYRLCDDYPYVAIGGIAIKDIKRSEYSAFPQMIKEAHKRGAKVHGLGFTNLKLLPSIHFDSVDSSTWLVGNRIGCAFQFTGTTMKRVYKKDGQRVINASDLMYHNFREWVKFQRYADSNY